VVEPDILGRMLARAIEYLPGIADLSALRAWTGHRATTPDKIPVLGPISAHGRPWLATGHEGLGITTSLATARLLVDQILGRASQIPREPYSAVRFVEEARMPDRVTLRIDGEEVTVQRGTSVCAAVLATRRVALPDIRPR